MNSILSIRAVLVSLGAVSILIASCLAGFGLLAMQQQLDARQDVIVLEEALKNHNSADAFMDSARTDVLRALQNAIGANHEGSDTIKAELRHHIEMLTTGISDNQRLPMGPELHQRYEQIEALLPAFVTASQTAVELALTDPAAGSANFEVFRHSFTALEELMDEVRDVVHQGVTEVRQGSVRTAMRARRMIVGSLIAGILMLTVITVIAIRIAQRITSALASSREQAEHLALHDTLTELANRGFLTERLQQDLTHARRDNTGLAILCLDLDRFKQVNDTLGHPVGDGLLVAAAERLQSCVREGDTVARLGGDEFAIIHLGLRTSDDAEVLANRIIAAFQKPFDVDGRQVIAGSSLGVTVAPDDSVSYESLMRDADIALYLAKTEGRGTARYFRPEMDTRIHMRRMLELDLQGAVGRNEFELYYQPQINLASNCISGFEALLRWNHPERGLVSPLDFIPLAEETGMIVAIGEWVLRTACFEAENWPDNISVAVNISTVQFKKGDLVATVQAALAASGLRPDRLELEITESVLLRDTVDTLTALHRLSAMGICVALDDFGTGYSSLSYLRSFPFNKIKIDQSFVRDLTTNKESMSIVRAVTGLGQSLGMKTTAEGVETQKQLERLREEGCTEVQGYFFSRPRPVSDLPLLIERLQNVGSSAMAQKS